MPANFPTADEPSDAELIAAAQRGEEQAFTGLARRHLPAVSTFTDVALLSGVAAWRDLWFTAAQRANSAISGPLADANGDGVNNLLAYAAGFSPWTTATTANGGVPLASSTGGYLALAFARRKNAPDLTWSAEVSGNLTTWNAGAGYTTLVSIIPLDDAREWVTVRDNTPMSGATRRSMRVRVTSP